MCNPTNKWYWEYSWLYKTLSYQILIIQASYIVQCVYKDSKLASIKIEVTTSELLGQPLPKICNEYDNHYLY